MAAEIIQIDPQDLITQIYESQDTNLIPSFEINTALTSDSYIEFFIYDLNKNLISSDSNFTQYSILKAISDSLAFCLFVCFTIIYI